MHRGRRALLVVGALTSSIPNIVCAEDRPSAAPAGSPLALCPTPSAAEAGCKVASAPEAAGTTAWLSMEYLGWFGKGDRLPPLLTASPAGTPRVAAGVLGQNTSILYGDQTTGAGYRSGFRILGGAWLSPDWGFDAGAFAVGQQSSGYATAPDGTSIVARPFFNAATGLQDAELVNFPGVLSGGAAVSGASQVVGANAGLRRNLWRCNTPNAACGCIDGGSGDLLVGYRFLQLNDRLAISEELTATDPNSNVPAGTRLTVSDRFRVLNTYHGGYLGFAWERRSSCWFLGANVRLGLGALTTRAMIAGETTVATPVDPPLTRAGGLLAQGTNSGTHTTTRAAFLPELGVRAGRELGNLRLFVGYDFLLLTNVSRIGDVVDPAVNPTQIPPGLLAGPARPAYAPTQSNYWLQGWSAGMELRF